MVKSVGHFEAKMPTMNLKVPRVVSFFHPTRGTTLILKGLMITMVINHLQVMG